MSLRLPTKRKTQEIENLSFYSVINFARILEVLTMFREVNKYDGSF